MCKDRAYDQERQYGGKLLATVGRQAGRFVQQGVYYRRNICMYDSKRMGEWRSFGNISVHSISKERHIYRTTPSLHKLD